MAGVVSSSNFAKLLEPGLRKLFFEAYDEVGEQYSKIYNVNTSKKAMETDFHVQGVGLWPVKESMGSVAYETIDPGNTISYTHVEYSKGIQVERKLVDDEQYEVINKLPKALARKGRATVEIEAVKVLQNGFTVNGYDGVPLFSDSHQLGKSSSVGDNLYDQALADASLKVALNMMHKTMDDTGIIIQAKATDLIIPPDLEFTALTLLNSAQLVGSPNNDINVLKGRLNPIVLDYLTDTNNWYLRDSSLSELNFFWRVKPEFKTEDNFDTMIAKYRGYFRFSVGYSDWRGWIGVNVTGA